MTTALRNIFAKPVDRPIDGVIKADDEASLRIELDEYVITDEIGKRSRPSLMPIITTTLPMGSGFLASLVLVSRTS